MNLIYNLKIAAKLRFVVMATVTAALLGTGSAVFYASVTAQKKALLRNVQVLADITGRQTVAAIVFDDAEECRNIIGQLRGDPELLFVCVFNEDGSIFASQQGSSEERVPPPAATLGNHHQFSDRALVVSREIVQDEETYGVIYLEYGLGGLDRHIWKSLWQMGGILLLALVLAWFISGYLSRIVTGPILGLSSVAQRISDEKDYGIRASRISHDEVGMLVDTFNEMVGRIQERDEEIGRHRVGLEEQVLARTEDLAAANKQLEAFAYSVSHDLRAPLRRMNGFSRALLQTHADKLDEQGKHYLERVCAGAQGMGELIDALLDLSRIMRRELKRGRVDLRTIALQIAEDLQKSEPDRDMEFVLPKEAIADGDDPLLRVALQNLIGNAWKFTGKMEKEGRIEFGAAGNAECGARNWEMKLSFTSSATTVRVSTWPMRISSSAPFSGCTVKMNSKEPESAWPQCNASFTSTAVAYGPRARWGKGQRSTSRWGHEANAEVSNERQVR